MHKRHIWLEVLFAGLTIFLWISVALNYYNRQESTLLNWNNTQMALVKNVAAAAQGWMELRLQQGVNSSQAVQEIVTRFIQPVHLLEDTTFWIYRQDRIIYNQDPGFLAEYQGQAIAQIFSRQQAKGASHFDEVVQGVLNAAQGSGWYIWQPETGRQFAAWTPVTIQNEAWTFGISTPEPEVLAFSGSQQALQFDFFGAGVITVLLWCIYFLIWRERKAEFSQLEILEKSASDRTKLAQRVDRQSEELAQINAELKKASSAKDDFLSAMGHELRTPLSTIIGLTYALQCQVYGQVTEKQAKSLETILTTTQHLSALVNDILDLSKIQSGKMKLDLHPISLSSLLDACMAFIDQQAYRKNIKLSIDRDPQVNWIEGDELRLKQLLFNLLNNAVKFTPAGGQVGIEARGNLPEKRIEITVWDTGIGIAAVDFARLFKPFVQLDSGISRLYSGSGLGLSLVAHIIELHNGSIAVNSEVGKGSRFTIALPWQGNDYQEPVEESQQIIHTLEQIPRPGQSSKILIVDDEPQNSLLLADFLTAAGYEVILAESGKSAIRLGKEHQPYLALVDLHIQDMDGLDLIRSLRAESPAGKIKVVAFNSLVLPGDQDAALHAGANDYVQKPLSFEKVALLVQTLLQKDGKAAPL